MPSESKKPASAAPAPQPIPSAPTNQFALWSMISGIVSLTIGWFIPFPTGIVAVVLGHIGLSQLKKSGDQGRQYAITGLIFGYAAIAIGIIIAVLITIVFGAMFLGVFGGYPMPNDFGMMHP